MRYWDPSLNWTYEEFIKVTTDAFEIEKKQSVCLDVEHCDHKNMESIISWAKEKGYRAEKKNSDAIIIYKT